MTDHVPSPTTREPSTEAGRALLDEASETMQEDIRFPGDFPDLCLRIVAIEKQAAQARVRALEEAAKHVILEHSKWRRNTAWGTGEPEAFSTALLGLSAILAAEQPTPERDGGLRDRVASFVQDIPMPWYDESDPDFTEAIDFIVDRLAASPATPADTKCPGGPGHDPNGGPGSDQCMTCHGYA